MKSKTYGFGGFIGGFWVGNTKMDNEQQYFTHIKIFPLSIMFVFANAYSCIRMHLFEYVKISLAVELK